MRTPFGPLGVRGRGHAFVYVCGRRVWQLRGSEPRVFGFYGNKCPRGCMRSYPVWYILTAHERINLSCE